MNWQKLQEKGGNKETTNARERMYKQNEEGEKMKTLITITRGAILATLVLMPVAGFSSDGEDESAVEILEIELPELPELPEEGVDAAQSARKEAFDRAMESVKLQAGARPETDKEGYRIRENRMTPEGDGLGEMVREMVQEANEIRNTAGEARAETIGEAQHAKAEGDSGADAEPKTVTEQVVEREQVKSAVTDAGSDAARSGVDDASQAGRDESHGNADNAGKGK